MPSFARSWVKRLERRSKAGLSSFELTDGSRFYYDPLAAYADFIVYAYDLARGAQADPPEVYRRLPEAADIPAALEQLRPARPDLAPHTLEIFDIERLLERRELVVREEALEPAVDLSESF